MLLSWSILAGLLGLWLAAYLAIYRLRQRLASDYHLDILALGAIALVWDPARYEHIVSAFNGFVLFVLLLIASLALLYMRRHRWVGRSALGLLGVPVLRANYAFRAVRLSLGHHQVRLAFEPTSWKVGLGISVATWIGLAAWGLLSWRSHLKNKKRRA